MIFHKINKSLKIGEVYKDSFQSLVNRDQIILENTSPFNRVLLYSDIFT